MLVLVIIDAFRALHRTTYVESCLFKRLKEHKLPETLVLNKVKLYFRLKIYYFSYYFIRIIDLFAYHIGCELKD